MGERYLIRHGESEANAGLATPDPRTIRLTPLGRRQAILVAEEINARDIRPDLIVVSPNTRTKETAEPTRQLFPDVQLEVWDTQEFNYLAKFHGIVTSTADRRAERNAYWDRSEPDFVHSPGSESFNDFASRVSKAMEKLRSTEKTTLFFGHEQFMCCLLWLTSGERDEMTSDTMKEFRSFMAANRIPNGSLVSLDSDAKSWEVLFVPKNSENSNEELKNSTSP